MDRIRHLQARAVEIYEALGSRERLQLAIVLLLFGTLFVGLITWQLRTTINDRASRVRSAKENLVQAQEMAAEYSVLQARLQAAEARMGQFKPSQMNTYLERWATGAGVQPNMRIQPIGEPSVVGSFKEQSVRVQLDDVLLEGLVDFLYAVETSPYPIRVRTAKFKATEKRDERFIDLDMELVAYTKEEG
ncbi:MAG: hypothetical protein H6733_02770 [Alphaproteobacteria bacterium]|nr:hypothetical protein [Alphaproteobacteria bacterium]